MLGSPRAHSPAPPLAARGRKTGLKSRATQILALRFGWVVLVIWYEVGEFFHSLSTCRFPDSALRQAHPQAPPPTHVVLIADPHVPHARLSYPSGNPWLNWAKQQMDELFMRKSWNVVMRLGRVDQVLVLGDMLDSGRGVMSDEEYVEYIALFRSIFQLPPTTPMHFVPGNHDISLVPNGRFSSQARLRYQQHFKTPNTVLPISNHSFILLDAVGLVEEDYRRYASEMQFGEWDGVKGGVIEFVKDLRDNPPPGPKILLSHIPLARPEGAACGPLREKGRISKGAGPGYQNLLGSETSKFLLDAIQPNIVFSGDDHDYCDYVHKGNIREVTVKSFSSSTGIRRPGLQLLSLVPPPTESTARLLPTHADRPCFLPDQLGVYWRVYLPLAILTALYLFITNLRSAYLRWDRSSHAVSEKMRSSPALLSAETMSPNSFSSRRNGPVPLSIPSRKSSSHLPLSAPSAIPSSTLPRPVRYNSTPAEYPPGSRSGQSNPVSPFGSPKLSAVERFGERDVERDGEAASASVTGLNTPLTLSRRSSYIYMDRGFPSSVSDSAPLSASGTTNWGLGANTGVSSPSSSGFIRRVSSANLSTLVTTNVAPPSLSITSPGTPRRVTLPSPLLLPHSPAHAQAHPLSQTSSHATHPHPAVIYTFPTPSRSWFWFERAKSFLRWAWKARKGAVGKSWRELISVAWVGAIVWLGVNALFFLE
ncbi:hypothetical protein C347_04099 [Cryptococcus neoformans AD2-60a]|nr:hypothetical protein C347_04099 [Cryptococcus neoformans var. grubii AD2-60a]OXC84021.1 hypothetical protein C344_03795 [Cryptococcus neoformans var. grubii AD1-7a]OXG31366.1 hypothetical protein C360_04571 [Cryptococcus neoformans var. grubii Bt15]OXH30551.1 hypothetical protein J005_03886 [Cryptococcus neoformans var. grubii]